MLYSLPIILSPKLKTFLRLESFQNFFFKNRPLLLAGSVGSRTGALAASMAFVRENHHLQVDSPHKRPVTRKVFPFDDVIMSFYYIHTVSKSFFTRPWCALNVFPELFWESFSQGILAITNIYFICTILFVCKFVRFFLFRMTSQFPNFVGLFSEYFARFSWAT